LTFKLPGDRRVDERQLAERHWTFAHAHGISLGNVSGTQLSQLAKEVWQLAGALPPGSPRRPADLHVWEPSPSAGDSVGSAAERSPLCHEIENAVRAAAPEACAKLRQPSSNRRRPTARGKLVLDIVVLEPGSWWIGSHRAVTWPARWPGGVIPVRLPSYVVSRAYAKIEEAIQWSGLPLMNGDECVEIGCAPGGASQALLDRGLFVTGIDPADVDPSVLSHPRFRHLKKRGQDVRRQEFLGVRWLVADMNIPPEAALDEVEAIVTHPGITIRGMILTLKFSDWNLAERLPEFSERVYRWGYRDVRAHQLARGGQEVCLVALRRKALRRLGQRPGRHRQRSVERRDAPPVGPSPQAGTHSDLQAL
jgi:23S rRNA (cytidine2498-2'-O)-methyltransferase